LGTFYAELSSEMQINYSLSYFSLPFVSGYYCHHHGHSGRHFHSHWFLQLLSLDILWPHNGLSSHSQVEAAWPSATFQS